MKFPGVLVTEHGVRLNQEISGNLPLALSIVLVPGSDQHGFLQSARQLHLTPETAPDEQTLRRSEGTPC